MKWSYSVDGIVVDGDFYRSKKWNGGEPLVDDVVDVLIYDMVGMDVDICEICCSLSMSRGQEHRGGTETACVICPALGGGMRPEGAEGAEGGG